MLIPPWGEKGPFFNFLFWHWHWQCWRLLMLIAVLEAAQRLKFCSREERIPRNELIHWQQSSELLFLLTVPPPAPTDYSRRADAIFWKTAGLSCCGMRITLLFDSCRQSKMLLCCTRLGRSQSPSLT